MATSLSQYWNACTTVIERMPPVATVMPTTTATTSEPAHCGAPVSACSVMPAPWSCGSRYSQPMSTTSADDVSRTFRDARAHLGEVRQRVGPRAAQRCGDEDQQDEVADGVADGEPQHVDAVRQHEAGDAEERRRREVLAADRGRVEQRAHRPRGHEEVRRRARHPYAEEPDADRRDDHGDDRGDRPPGGHRFRTARRGRRTPPRCARLARTYHQAAPQIAGNTSSPSTIQPSERPPTRRSRRVGKARNTTGIPPRPTTSASAYQHCETQLGPPERGDHRDAQRRLLADVATDSPTRAAARGCRPRVGHRHPLRGPLLHLSAPDARCARACPGARACADATPAGRRRRPAR